MCKDQNSFSIESPGWTDTFKIGAMAVIPNDSGVTNYKKLFNKHVHEQFFLKKHMNKIDYEMRQRDKEISESQVKFAKKYKQFIGLRNKHKRNNNDNDLRRSSCSDIPEIDDKHKPRKQSIDLKFTSQRRTSLVEKIRKNSFVEPPVDFPYSFPIWHAKVDHGTIEDDGSDPRELRRDNLLLSLDRLSDKFNQNDQEKCSDISNADDRSGNTKVSRMNCKNVDISNIKVEFDSDTIVNGSEKGNEQFKNHLKLPGIHTKPNLSSYILRTNSIENLLQRKVHFKPETEIIDIRNIDTRLGKRWERRRSFSEFKTNVMKSS